MSDEHKNTVPANDLHFLMMTTEPQWGQNDALPNDMRDRSRKETVFVDRETNEVVRRETLDQWQIGSLLTRDARLGNIGVFTGELSLCDHMCNFAHDTMRAFMEDDEDNIVAGSAFVALNRVQNTLELSHSKNGWFRKQSNTFTTESRHEEMGPPKKDFFGRVKNSR